jgi:hypothetical protein
MKYFWKSSKIACRIEGALKISMVCSAGDIYRKNMCIHSVSFTDILVGTKGSFPGGKPPGS